MGERDRNTETGKFTSEFNDHEFLDAIRTLDGTGGTTEIADIVGCDRRTAYLRLRTLEESGEITSRSAGNTLLWRQS